VSAGFPWNLPGAPGVRRVMKRTPTSPDAHRPSAPRIFTASAVLGLALVACGGGGSSPPTTGPTAGPSAIDHPTGATEVVFRFREGGGFVPIDFFATEAPQFTLYGDGTAIFRDTSSSPPPPIGEVSPLNRFATVRLSESDVQAFLRFALDASALAIAQGPYSPGNVADAPIATFTLHAGGMDKTVSVEALGFDNLESPDAPIIKALAGLGEVVRDYAPHVSGEITWAPDRWRGILTELPAGSSSPGGPWPWTDVTPIDFVRPAGQDAPRFPIHTLTRAQVDLLGLTGIEGGFRGLTLLGPDGRTYAFSLRPILPDEQF
jgi:hypothetical protein